MKTTILAIILAISLCTTAYILNRNFHGNVLIERIAKTEIQMGLLQSKFEESNRNAQMVIEEVRKIVTTAYSHIIPVNKGFIAIKEE